MPDHVHLVIEGLEERSDLKQFIRLAKQLSGYYWSQTHQGQRLWQRYGYERVLRDDEATRDVVRYVLENPLRAQLASAVDEYPFVGSTLYARESLIEFAFGSGETSGERSGERSGLKPDTTVSV